MILSCGEALIDMLPRTATTGEAAFAPYAGGAVFNTAIALGRLGAPSGFLSGVSTDMLGEILAEAGVPRDAITWTRGSPATFNSSDKAARGFCRDCGTPLTYDYAESKHINLTTGSFDDPSQFPPRVQFGVEGQLSLFEDLPIKAEGTTEETMAAYVGAIKASNHQHPDHDTARWPE